MTASIVLTGLSSTDPVPGHYLQVNFAVGEAGGFAGSYSAILIGNKTTAGDATVETVYGPQSDLPVQTEDDVIARTGTGSELHRMWRRFNAVNKETPVHLIAVAESAGAAATLVVTFTTTAGANGTARLYVDDEFVEVPIATGDTVTTIAAAAKAAINAQTHWAVTADNAAGVLTITAKNLGPRGNQLRGNALVLGAGVATTVSPTVVTAFSGGTTEDSYTNVLAAILARRFYYIVSASNNATQLGALITQVNSQALPTSGIRQRVFAGFHGTSGNGITLATGRNAALAEIAFLEEADWTPAELAANMAAVASLEELPRPPRHNFSFYGNDPQTQATWLVPAPRSGKRPTRATIKSLLESGLSPIGVNDNGSTYLVKRITTRSLNGATVDYRIRDSHRVTEMHFFADDLLTKLQLQFGGKDLGNDLGPGQKPTAPNLVTPQMIKASVFRLYDDYFDDGRMKNVAAVKAATIVQRSTAAPNRVEIRIPWQNIDIFDQSATALDQVS